MQNPYDLKDAVVVIRTSDAAEGADFTSSIVHLGAGYIYSVVRKKDETSLPLLATAFIMVSNQTGSVKIPLSQETIKELKEKGFI